MKHGTAPRYQRDTVWGNPDPRQGRARRSFSRGPVLYLVFGFFFLNQGLQLGKMMGLTKGSSVSDTQTQPNHKYVLSRPAAWGTS